MDTKPPLIERYKLAIDTLITGQTLLIQYAKDKIFTDVCIGLTLSIIAFLPPYNTASLVMGVIFLILAGFRFNSAYREYQHLNNFRAGLEELETIEHNVKEEEKTINSQ